jgi:hypothetical protein
MSSPTELAARTYAALFAEPDRSARERMLEACWATHGRLVTRGTPVVGRLAIAAMVDAFFADPRKLRVRLLGDIDVQGPLFRMRAVVETAEGTQVGAVSFDAGEVDAEGRIATILTFNDPPRA